MTSRPLSARRDSFRTTIEFDLAQADGSMLPVPTTLSYDATDPFAVRALFVVADCAVEWVFARDLLADGLRSISGAGDINIWSYTDDGVGYVWLALSSPSGRALLRGRAGAVSAFLDHSYAMVPIGEESLCLDLDREMEALLRAS